MAELDVIQRWFQSVVTHPDGVGRGVESTEAQKLIVLRRKELEKVILRSKNLSAADRMSIYANAYYARLIECLGESFPVFRRTVGKELFHDFAVEYLQMCPSGSYTLSRLGDRFARHLEQTRPRRPEDSADWADFLIDLVRLEWTIEQVFDGPGLEKEEPMDAAAWRLITPDAWPKTRLVTAPCLQLMSLSYPVNDYYTLARRAEPQTELNIPEPAEQWLAVTRRDFIVHRYELSRPQFALLDSLLVGGTIGEAIAAAASATQMGDDELASALNQWFRLWTQQQFFVAVTN